MHRRLDRSSRFLAALAVLQTLFLLTLVLRARHNDTPSEAVRIEVGDTLASVRVTTDSGQSLTVREVAAGADWTALLAIYTHCAWCDSIAPDWARILRTERRYRAVLLGHEATDTIAAYVDEKSLRAPFVTAFGAPDGSIERALTGRTPWVYLVDSSGVLRFSGGGGSLVTLDSVIGQLSEDPR